MVFVVARGHGLGISLSGSRNPPNQTRTNRELFRVRPRVDCSVNPLSYFSPSLKDGVSSGATATQRFGRYLPGSTEQEPRGATAGCRGSQTICKSVIALALLAFRCSRGSRSQTRWPRCPLVQRPRCGTTQSTDVSSISFTVRTRQRSWEGYWLSVRLGVVILDPGNNQLS